MVRPIARKGVARTTKWACPMLDAVKGLKRAPRARRVRRTLGSGRNGGEATFTLRAMTGLMQCSKQRGKFGFLLDHLVCAQQERLGDRQAKGLGGDQVDGQIEFGRLLDR